MEKVKVSLEVANAMKELESWIGGDKDRVDKVLKVAELLAYGYEVEQTPEERFNYFYDKYSKSNIQFEKDFLNGMLAVAKWFNLDVKGAND